MPYAPAAERKPCRVNILFFIISSDGKTLLGFFPWGNPIRFSFALFREQWFLPLPKYFRHMYQNEKTDLKNNLQIFIFLFVHIYRCLIEKTLESLISKACYVRYFPFAPSDS